ncbi:MAG: hypothetical protein ABIA93_07235 [Candidatus Woesearchaeota archaeon]
MRGVLVLVLLTSLLVLSACSDNAVTGAVTGLRQSASDLGQNAQNGLNGAPEAGNSVDGSLSVDELESKQLQVINDLHSIEREIKALELELVRRDTEESRKAEIRDELTTLDAQEYQAENEIRRLEEIIRVKKEDK